MSYASEDFAILGLSIKNWMLLVGIIVIAGIAALITKL
jgi:hypothetical protein